LSPIQYGKKKNNGSILYRCNTNFDRLNYFKLISIIIYYKELLKNYLNYYLNFLIELINSINFCGIIVCEVILLDKIYNFEEIKSILFPIFMTSAVRQAVLFGSYAKGQATNKSDIDIVIDSNGELLNINFYGLLDEITERLNKNIDLFEISEIKQNSPIYKAIQSEGVLLYEC